MNKRFTKLLIVLLLILMPGCVQSAPSISEVSGQCQKDNRQPGQSVVFAETEYICPSPSPTPTPIVNISNALLQTVESLCKENGDAWQDPSNAYWLAENVVGPANSWQYKDRKWVYTYVPEFITLTFGGYTQEYMDRFLYPGFGTLLLYLYKGDTVTVRGYYPQYTYAYTRLDLTCP